MRYSLPRPKIKSKKVVNTLEEPLAREPENESIKSYWQRHISAATEQRQRPPTDDNSSSSIVIETDSIGIVSYKVTSFLERIQREQRRSCTRTRVVHMITKIRNIKSRYEYNYSGLSWSTMSTSTRVVRMIAKIREIQSRYNNYNSDGSWSKITSTTHQLDQQPLDKKVQFNIQQMENDHRTALAAEKDRGNQLLVNLAKTKTEVLTLRYELTLCKKAKHQLEELVADLTSSSTKHQPQPFSIKRVLDDLTSGFSPAKKSAHVQKIMNSSSGVSSTTDENTSFSSGVIVTPDNDSNNIRSCTSPYETLFLPSGDDDSCRLNKRNVALISQLVNVVDDLPDRSGVLLKIELRRGIHSWYVQTAKVETKVLEPEEYSI